ncbi:MAG: iron-sulfur cluster assembly scaffold protein [Burkholderiaceae bacterium]|nr:iron-sulfur cluster assembly scaffold protein [Burkholderiaceae bacterium]
MAYSSLLLDHYRHPRNVGAFDSKCANVGTGMVGTPAEGLVVKLQIAVGETGQIESARFKTYGCAAAIAAGSLATELLTGKTLDQAMAVRHTDIAQALELPPIKIHCSILTEDAIKAAVNDYKGKQE